MRTWSRLAKGAVTSAKQTWRAWVRLLSLKGQNYKIVCYSSRSQVNNRRLLQKWGQKKFDAKASRLINPLGLEGQMRRYCHPADHCRKLKKGTLTIKLLRATLSFSFSLSLCLTLSSSVFTSLSVSDLMEPWNDSQKRLWRKLDLEVAKLAKDFRSVIMITFIESAASF